MGQIEYNNRIKIQTFGKPKTKWFTSLRINLLSWCPSSPSFIRLGNMLPELKRSKHNKGKSTKENVKIGLVKENYCEKSTYVLSIWQIY